MRIMTAYFAGVGTVAVAIAAGLGGGLLFANIGAPHEPRYAEEPTKLEQRMAARTIPVTSATSEPAPYLAATQPAATNPVVVVAAPQPQAESSAAPAAEPQSANNATADQVNAPPQAQISAERQPAASPHEAFGRARDADIKRAATEKHRAERRQQWAGKRRDRQPQEHELEAVEQSIRGATEPRQAFMAEPVKLDAPGIKLFGDE